MSESDYTANCPWKNMYSLDHWSKKRIETAVRMLYPYLKEGDRVYDIGCFTQQAKAYLPLGTYYLGIDKEVFVEPTTVMDLDNPQRINASHILLCEVLEHLKDPLKLLQALDFEGRLVVSLPNEATLFHRFRCLLGTVDAECFSGQYKHLHLPSLKQARNLLSQIYEIEDERYYISPSSHKSRQQWVGRILERIPVRIHYVLSRLFPSLFARGWIFLLKKKVDTQSTTNPPMVTVEPTP